MRHQVRLMSWLQEVDLELNGDGRMIGVVHYSASRQSGRNISQSGNDASLKYAIILFCHLRVRQLKFEFPMFHVCKLKLQVHKQSLFVK
jgi:hypothetical protein